MHKVLHEADKNPAIKEGVCPGCGSTAMEYFSRDVKDSSVTWEFTCGGCGLEGTEVHSMSFLGYELETEAKEQRYIVEVARTSVRHTRFEVMALSEESASLKAIARAGDHDFSCESEKSLDYMVAECTPVEG